MCLVDVLNMAHNNTVIVGHVQNIEARRDGMRSMPGHLKPGNSQTTSRSQSLIASTTGHMQ